MITRISSILAAGLMLITVSVASAATIHRQVRHHFPYRHQPVIMLLENNPAVRNALLRLGCVAGKQWVVASGEYEGS
jgi:hypothetical protein